MRQQEKGKEVTKSRSVYCEGEFIVEADMSHNVTYSMRLFSDWPGLFNALNLHGQASILH